MSKLNLTPSHVAQLEELSRRAAAADNDIIEKCYFLDLLQRRFDRFFSQGADPAEMEAIIAAARQS